MKAGSLAFSVQHLLVVADFRDMAWVGAVRCNIAARMLSQSGTQREKKHVLKVLLWFCVFCLFLLRFVFMGPLAGLCIGPLPVLFRLSKCRRPCISHNWSSCCGWTCVTTWQKPWRRWKEKKKEKARTGSPNSTPFQPKNRHQNKSNSSVTFSPAESSGVTKLELWPFPFSKPGFISVLFTQTI